ncbi:hypothetical protein, partial [Algoriphagus hitonicola]|uniref:hypothetical protein n=1 Tax=Algoriphagus hitonicola TaxID=435880 RepID=UPI001C430674
GHCKIPKVFSTFQISDLNFQLYTHFKIHHWAFIIRYFKGLISPISHLPIDSTFDDSPILLNRLFNN